MPTHQIEHAQRGRRIPARRRFLTMASVAGASVVIRPALDAQAPAPAGAAQPPGPVLAIGAHYDDCPFGIPGVLLQAVAARRRVVVLSLIGDYTNWKRVEGRGDAVVTGTSAINADYGVESRFLPFASGRLHVDEHAVRLVAEVVADVRPEVAFILWPHDQHPDHVAASAISTGALRLGDRVLPDPFAPYERPRRTYQFDNGPRHTIGFVPDTFVDVTPQWPRSSEWLGRLMALVRDEPYVAGELDGAQRARETLVRYRGATCGVDYAEAVKAVEAYPQAIF